LLFKVTSDLSYCFCFYLLRTVDDFDDWANWLFYRGGVGVKSDDSWETWWEEEHVKISFSFFHSPMGLAEQVFFPKLMEK
jgi:hypothetical protein